jgi:hypothetical protein
MIVMDFIQYSIIGIVSILTIQSIPRLSSIGPTAAIHPKPPISTYFLHKKRIKNRMGCTGGLGGPCGLRILVKKNESTLSSLITPKNASLNRKPIVGRAN